MESRSDVRKARYFWRLREHVTFICATPRSGRGVRRAGLDKGQAVNRSRLPGILVFFVVILVFHGAEG
jgi:hypothetical protein